MTITNRFTHHQAQEGQPVEKGLPEMLGGRL